MRYCQLVRCLACDAINRDASFDASFENSFSHRRFCSVCGSKTEFYDSTEHWISTSIRWKPWTWFSGYWVKKA